MRSVKKGFRFSMLWIHLVLILFCLLCILPLVSIVSISLTSEADIYDTGYKLIPVKVDTTAYQLLFKMPDQLLNSYAVTISVTLVGTALGVLVNSLIAYPLSRKEFKYRRAINFFVYFPMLFSGGLIPWYILIMQYLQMKDTFWVLFVPSLASAWNILLLKTYFSKIPVSLFESATMDGANEPRIFLQILLPLSKPSLATVGFMTSLTYWNDWWMALLFIENDKLLPLQYLLQRIMSNIEALQVAAQRAGLTVAQEQIPKENVRMAMCIIAAGPMLFIFQFFQKYFVKGLTVGSIKG